MTAIDIEKKQLRKELLCKRKQLDKSMKAQNDGLIADNLCKLRPFNECENLLIYSSTAIEVSTDLIIERAFSLNKKVAFPVCGENSSMEFYYVNSVDELQISSFGIPAPNPEESRKAVPDENTLCVLPGLAFDRRGFRLGFGRGFYDRYLQRYPVKTAGVCYSDFIFERLAVDGYDKKADFIVTEKSIEKF